MLYEILKDFPGSQDGRFAENFKAGTVVELSDYLAAIVVPEGWAVIADVAYQAPLPGTEIDNKAVVSDGNRPKRTRKA
jgi:hypothetical protein